MNQETFCTTGLRKTTRVAVLAFAASQAASLLPAQQAPGGVDQTLPQTDEQLSVETAGPWAPRVNVNADLAMVYPLDPIFQKTWSHGSSTATKWR
jgi:hypothetical protein